MHNFVQRDLTKVCMQRNQEPWAGPSPMGSSSSHSSPWALITSCGWYSRVPGPLASRRQAGQLSQPLPGAPHQVSGCLDGPAPQRRPHLCIALTFAEWHTRDGFVSPGLWLRPCQPGWVTLGWFPPCGPVMPAIPLSPCRTPHHPEQPDPACRLQALQRGREKQELNLSS